MLGEQHVVARRIVSRQVTFALEIRNLRRLIKRLAILALANDQLLRHAVGRKNVDVILQDRFAKLPQKVTTILETIREFVDSFDCTRNFFCFLVSFDYTRN